MPPDETKAVARRIYELLGVRDIKGLRKVIDATLVDHSPCPGQAPGVDGILDVLQMRFRAFPDLAHRIEDQIAEGDKVMTRYTWWGTHRGEMHGIAPSGRRVQVPGIEIHQVKGGQVTDVWRIEDYLSLMRQLNVVSTIGEGEGGCSKML